MVGVEQWAEIRRMYFVKRLSIKEIVRRTGHGRNTIRRALRAGEPPCYRRPLRPSKLDPFRDEVHRLLRSDPCLLERTVTIPAGVASVRVVLKGFAPTDLRTAGSVTFDEVGLYGA